MTVKHDMLQLAGFFSLDILFKPVFIAVTWATLGFPPSQGTVEPNPDPVVSPLGPSSFLINKWSQPDRRLCRNPTIFSWHGN